MVFYNNDEYQKECIVECDCGTHGIKFKNIIGEDEIYISPYIDTFYSKQRKSFFRRLGAKIAFIWKIIRNKEYLFEEIVIGEESRKDLIKALQCIGKVESNESK